MFCFFHSPNGERLCGTPVHFEVDSHLAQRAYVVCIMHDATKGTNSDVKI